MCGTQPPHQLFVNLGQGERPTCALCRKWNLRCEYTVPASLREEEPLSSYAMRVPPGDTQQPFSLLAPWDPTLPLQLADFELNAFSGTQDALTPGMSYPTPTTNPEHLSASGGGDDSQSLFLDLTFPNSEVANELIGIFFDKIYFMLPCFHKQTFLEEFHSGHVQVQSPLLLYSMYSVAAGFHPDPAVKGRRNTWYEEAKLMYDFTGRAPEPALRVLQAVLFLVYHAYTCGDYSACWLYIGKAWRQAASLGMNRMDSAHAVVMPVGQKDGPDEEHRGYYNRREWTGCTVGNPE